VAKSVFQSSSQSSAQSFIQSASESVDQSVAHSFRHGLAPQSAIRNDPSRVFRRTALSRLGRVRPGTCDSQIPRPLAERVWVRGIRLQSGIGWAGGVGDCLTSAAYDKPHAANLSLHWSLQSSSQSSSQSSLQPLFQRTSQSFAQRIAHGIEHRSAHRFVQVFALCSFQTST